jgi:hypothetical protein
MKRFSLLLGVVAVIVLLTATGAFAEEAKKGPGGRGGGTMGEITKIDGKNITVKSSREGAPDVTGAADDATEITISVPAKLADLKVGDQVRITQGEKRAYGEITKIDGKTLTLKGRGDESQTVTIEEGAVIAVAAKAKFEDLKVGQQVMASVREGKFTRISVRMPEKK